MTSSSAFISFRVAEAEADARYLKQRLANIGVQAFVSSDDLTVGDDWRDMIAAAMLSSRVFIALVTATYGAPGTTTQGTMEELIEAKRLKKEGQMELIVSGLTEYMDQGIWRP